MNPVYEWREAPETAFAVIGDPIAHSLSPLMQTAALRAIGRTETYLAVHVLPGEVAQALDRLKSLGTVGVNVTLPHKLAALEWAKSPDPAAVRLGAANTLNLQTGEARNTDESGFASMIENLSVPKGRALVLGAGGSARAILVALENLGYEIGLFNRTRSRAEEVIASLDLRQTQVLDHARSEGYSVVVNTTSASHDNEAPEIDFKNTDSSVFAIDLSYYRTGTSTPFLSAAAKQGLQIHDGRAMLVYQGALALQWWLGAPEVELSELVRPMAMAVGLDRL